LRRFAGRVLERPPSRIPGHPALTRSCGPKLRGYIGAAKKPCKHGTTPIAAAAAAAPAGRRGLIDQEGDRIACAWLALSTATGTVAAGFGPMIASRFD
jgi:hypothetical protein